MKTLILFIFPILVFAEHAVRIDGPIKLDPDNYVLEYKASVGDYRDGKFHRIGPSKKYKVHLIELYMTDGKKRYTLSLREGLHVGEFLEISLIRYAAASVEWFRNGGKYKAPPPELWKGPEKQRSEELGVSAKSEIRRE